MLVLSRKKDDSIVIDGNITIEVVQIKGNQVRLGIKAPQSVRILRGELTPYEVYPMQENTERKPSFDETVNDQVDDIELKLGLADVVAHAS